MTRVAMLVTSNLIHDNRVRKEAETLAAAGYRVTVFSHIGPDDVPRLGWDSRLGLVAIPVPPANWHGRRGLSRAVPHTLDLFRWGGSKALLRSAADCRADVYHAHDLDTLSSAAWLARRHHGRLVYDSHELFLEMIAPEPEAASPGWPSRAKQALSRHNYARLEHALIRRADAVITVGPIIAGELAQRYGIARPAVVLNTPPHRDLSTGSDYLRERIGLGPAIRLVLLQGAVLPGRGQVELVRSLTLLPDDVHLVFLGFNLGNFQAAIREEIERLELARRTHLLDALPPEQLLNATASADVGVLLLAGHNLNDRYAMPNKLFEYLMAGLPFVVSDWPEVGRVARETGAGLPIPAFTPEAIASGIQEVLATPERYRAMHAAGLDAARREYNWERQAEHLLEVYARVVP